jgi:hypothetical protein
MPKRLQTGIICPFQALSHHARLFFLLLFSADVIILWISMEFS